MNGILATLSRELRAYFFSPLAYMIMALFMLFNGAVFSLIISYLSDPRAEASATPLKFFFGGTLFFWFVLPIITTVLTMRLLAEERRSGTIETLMTAPVSETQVVLGKYLSALVFYIILWLPSLIYVLIVARSGTLDWGPVASGYLGVLGIGALYLALGTFASSLTKNQLLSALLTLVLTVLLFSVGFLEGLVNNPGFKEMLAYLNLPLHMEDFAKGIVDSRRLVYYFSAVVLFLFLSSRALAAKKWS
jgi:ABC-2 type transport system permease protein